MSDSNLNRLSAVLTIICAPGSIGSYLKNLPIFFTIALLVLALVSFGIWLRLYLKARNTNIKNILKSLSNVDDDAIHRDSYELLYHKTTIDICARDGSNSTCHQINRLKCLKNASNLYYFRYAPADHYADFKFTPGKIQSINKRANGTDIIVCFDRQCKLNETKEISIYSRIIGLLTDSEEYWCVQKYYNNSSSHILQIIFPVGITPDTYATEIVVNDMYRNARPTKNQIVEKVSDNRLILTIETNELKTGEKLRMLWTW